MGELIKGCGVLILVVMGILLVASLFPKDLQVIVSIGLFIALMVWGVHADKQTQKAVKNQLRVPTTDKQKREYGINSDGEFDEDVPIEEFITRFRFQGKGIQHTEVVTLQEGLYSLTYSLQDDCLIRLININNNFPDSKILDKKGKGSITFTVHGDGRYLFQVEPEGSYSVDKEKVTWSIEGKLLE